MRPIVIAHRTCPRDAPENSLEGIERAASMGADVVEVDVRRTVDGVPMLLHDRRLLRTTGRPNRIDRTAAGRVAQLSLRGGGRVPSLADALASLGPTMGMAIDVKDAGAGDAVLAEVRNQRLEARVLFWSQHEHAVRTAVAIAPEIEVSLLRDTASADELDRFVADALAFGARGISAHWSQVSPALADRCHASGLTLYAWCKTRAVDDHKLAAVDGLVTDWPERALELARAIRP